MPRLPFERKLPLSCVPIGLAFVSSSESEIFCCVVLMRRTWASTKGRLSLEKGLSLNSTLIYLKFLRFNSEL